MAVHVVLNELNQPVEMIDANQPGTRTRKPEFLAINPRGQIPILMVDGTPISEGGAQIIYLCDTHENTLIPKSGLERAKALEALMFCNATLHPAFSPAFGALGSTMEAAAKEAAIKVGLEKVQKLYDYVDAKLGQQKYMAGDRLTAADILLAVIANWSPTFGDALKIGENMKRVIREVSQRPAYQKALQAEGVEYKVAA